MIATDRDRVGVTAPLDQNAADGSRFFHHIKSQRGTGAREPVRFVPTPADHDRMLVVLAWGRGLDDQSWRIVRDHAHGFSERAIADRVHIPASAVARRYDAAITMVVQAALAAD